MKNILMCFLLFFGFYNGFALGYFPLHTGNQWDFGILNGPPNFGYQYIFSIKVLGDTIMPNSKQYAIVQQQNSISYKRQEGNILYNYNSSGDVVEHDFTYQDGDTTSRYFIPTDTILTIVHVGFGEIFGRNLKFWSFTTDAVNNHAYEPSWYTITDSLGYTYFGYSPGEYEYCMGVKVDGNIYGTITSVTDNKSNIPNQFQLFQNYPNPFNPTTKIDFILPKTSFTTLRVFDVLGREVSVLFAGELTAGHHSEVWNATNYSSGVYFYTLQSGKFSETKKLLLQK
jgi:hypothetical protein